MVQRRRDVSSSRRVKRTSDQVRSSMVGPRGPRAGRPSARHMNAESVKFSSTRKARKAAHGQVGTLMPRSTTAESAREYSRRAGRREYTREIQRKSRLKRVLLIAACVLVAVGAAVAVGLAVFFSSVSGRMSLGDSNAQQALVAPADGQATTYTLLAAELGAAQGYLNEDGPDAYVLAQANRDSKKVTLISLPSNLRLSYGDGQNGRLRDAAAVDDATLISAVSRFAGVDIAHYAKTDVENIGKMIDTLGGITLNLSEEVDDPRAGDVFIPAGQQTIGSGQIATLLRACNYTDGKTGQARVQCSVIAAILEKLAGGQGAIADATMIDSVSSTVSTDLTSQQALDMAQAFSGIAAGEVDIERVPGSETQRDGVTVFQASANSWTDLMERIDAGSQPSNEEQAADNANEGTVDHGSFTITVRNGAGITGAAAQMSEQLQADGFNVVETGNTDSPAYTETLIIYKDSAYEPAAEEVAASLANGRVVNGGDYYTFDSNILVVLGSDWKPLA